MRLRKIEIRMNEDEYQNLLRMKNNDSPLAKFARERLLSNLLSENKKEKIYEYSNIVYQLKKIGVNLNQIAFQLNSNEINAKEILTALRFALAEVRILADEKIKKE